MRAPTGATPSRSSSGVSEDEVKHAEKDLQKLHDDEIAKIDAAMKAKEAELMEV
jgi:ribosome recycling factor